MDIQVAAMERHPPIHVCSNMVPEPGRVGPSDPFWLFRKGLQYSLPPAGRLSRLAGRRQWRTSRCQLRKQNIDFASASMSQWVSPNQSESTALAALLPCNMVPMVSGQQGSGALVLRRRQGIRSSALSYLRSNAHKNLGK